jgi:cell division protein ZapA (FtsZ GTPase activity inhibitor)
LSKRSVAVRILGHEYKIRSDADEAWLQQVAERVDSAMTQIRERTGTVDTLDIAILTSLNLAREVLTLRAQSDSLPVGASAVEGGRLRALIELAESSTERGLSGGDRGALLADTPLLTLPTGDELDAVDAVKGELLGVMPEALQPPLGADDEIGAGVAAGRQPGDGAARGR